MIELMNILQESVGAVKIPIGVEELLRLTDQLSQAVMDLTDSAFVVELVPLSFHNTKRLLNYQLQLRKIHSQQQYADLGIFCVAAMWRSDRGTCPGKYSFTEDNYVIRYWSDYYLWKFVGIESNKATTIEGLEACFKKIATESSLPALISFIEASKPKIVK